MVPNVDLAIIKLRRAKETNMCPRSPEDVQSVYCQTVDAPPYSLSCSGSPGKRSRDSPMEDSIELDREDSRSSKSTHIGSHSRHEDSTEAKNASADCHKRNYTVSEDQELNCQGLRRASSPLNQAQQRLLRQWYQDFAHPDVAPDLPDARIASFASAIETQKELVADYIEQRREGSDTSYDMTDFDQTFPDIHRSTESSTQTYTLSNANSHLPPATLSLVEKYVSACRRRRSQNDGRRSVNTGPYRCTFGCGYRTKRVFDWRRHEETHEPQELWLCSICAVDNPFLVNRKDKFLKHAADKHVGVPAEGLMEKGKVPFVPRGRLECGMCGVESGSWDERCRHVLGHFEDEVERGLKRVKIVHEEDEDAEDEAAGNIDGRRGSDVGKNE